MWSYLLNWRYCIKENECVNDWRTEKYNEPKMINADDVINREDKIKK